MSVRINGQCANLLVDTGSNQVILDAASAESFGVRPSQRDLRYLQYTRINGQLLPVGFAQSLIAGSMNFGSTLVTLRDSSHSYIGDTRVDGVFGLDLLARYKAVIIAGRNLFSLKSIEHDKWISVPLLRRRNSPKSPCGERRTAP